MNRIYLLRRESRPKQEGKKEEGLAKGRNHGRSSYLALVVGLEISNTKKRD